MENKQKEAARQLHRIAVALLDSMNSSSRAEGPLRYTGYKPYMRKYNQLIQTAKISGVNVDSLDF